MKRLLSMALLLVTMISSMAVSASAADYTFDGVHTTDFYPSTSYEETYNARYNYGGTNLVVNMAGIGLVMNVTLYKSSMDLTENQKK